MQRLGALTWGKRGQIVSSWASSEKTILRRPNVALAAGPIVEPATVVGDLKRLIDRSDDRQELAVDHVHLCKVRPAAKDRGVGRVFLQSGAQDKTAVNMGIGE